MSSLVGILVIVVGLLISVALHELGHLVPAKRFGVLVPEYSVGFGPALASGARRGTRYVLRAILLGGYVRIAGMYAPARPGTPTVTRRGAPTLAEEARRASAADLDGARGRPFYELPAGRKAVVMLGGPAVNLLISVALIGILFLGIGVATPTTTLEAVPQTVTTSEDGATAPGPAAAAGIEPGDAIVSWDGVVTPTWDEVRAAVAASDGSAVPVVVRRGGVERTVTVAPVLTADGARVAGIQAAVEYRPESPGQAASAAWQLFTGTLGVVVRLPQAVWDVGASLATGAPRDPAGVVSVVGVGRLAGQITGDAGAGGSGAGTAATGAAAGAAHAREAAAQLLWLLASLNMALFVFNLIPLPPLDGGHVAGAAFEGLRRLWARLRGRPDPGPADTARMMPLSYAVGLALVAMTLLLVVADVVDPVRLG